jgi:hypothetical protein
MADDQVLSQDDQYGALLSRLINPPDEPAAGTQVPADFYLRSNPAQPAAVPAQPPTAPTATPTAPAQATAQATAAAQPQGTGKTWADYVRGGLDAATRAQQQSQSAIDQVQNEPTAEAANAGLEAKRAAIATPTPMRDAQGNLLPQYKPSFWQQVKRGLNNARLGAAGELDKVTPYSAPNKAYGVAEAARQAQVGSLDQQMSQNLANEKADTERGKELATEQRAQATTALDIGKTATGQQTAERSNIQGEANLAKAGLRLARDAEGNITGVEDDPDSQAYKSRQIMDDLREKQAAAAQANADLKNAQGNPNSQQYKLAQMRAWTANQNAQAAQIRARAYMLNATTDAFGTDEFGNPEQGATELGGKTVGSRFQTTVQKQQGQVAQFNDVLGATDNIEKVAQDLVSKGRKLNDPRVAAAIADPKSTAGQWAQGEFANSGLTPEERNYVIAVKGYKENLQALRKSAGGGVSDAQVNRLMEMAPGAQTPDIDYLKRQTGQIRLMAGRLSKGIPNVVGGEKVRTPPDTAPSSPDSEMPPKAIVDSMKEGQYVHGPGGSYQKKGGKLVPVGNSQ